MSDYKLVPVEPTAEMMCKGMEAYCIEDCEVIAQGHVLGIYKAMLAATPDVQGEPEETIGAVISLVKDAAAAHLNSEFNSCLSKIRKLLTAAPQPAEQQSISPTLASEAAKHLSNWLEMDMCECEFGHTCGYNEVKRTRDALLAVAEQKPVSHDWDDQDKCRRCGDRDWYASATCTPKPQPELAKYQPCGCVICTCEHETQCQGCGGHHCGTHPVGQFTAPAYLRPAPDVVGLQAELERERKRRFDGNEQASREHREDMKALLEALEKIAQSCDSGRHDGLPEDGPALSDVEAWIVANDALAAHRKGGDI